jgi:hypothetical protein
MGDSVARARFRVSAHPPARPGYEQVSVWQNPFGRGTPPSLKQASRPMQISISLKQLL